jgi:hypothetical protein
MKGKILWINGSSLAQKSKIRVFAHNKELPF